MLLPLGFLLADRFEIESILGHGGMAEVYLAHDRKLSMKVAVKLLYPHLRANSVLCARFQREVTAVRELDHPNIVRIYELIETPEYLFFTMQYIPGSDLKQRIRRQGAMPVETVIEIGSKLASALEAAHDHGIIHRDIKPQNVLISVDGQVKLADFGLAHMTGLAGLTVGTAVIATPDYSAPEVLSSAVADPRADLYSLGVILYEMATGKLPFRSGNLYDIIQRHIETTPPRLREMHPDVPQWLDELVAKVLSKDPEDRFQTAAEMRFALERRSLAPALSLTPQKELLCPHCGHLMLPFIALCFECGYEPMDLKSSDLGMYEVMLKGRRWFQFEWGWNRTYGDVLTYEQKGRLVKLLEELGGAKLEPKRVDSRLRRLPTIAFKGLSKDAALNIQKRIEALGIRARTVHGWSWRRLSKVEAYAWGFSLLAFSLSQSIGLFLFVMIGLGLWHFFRPKFSRPLGNLHTKNQFLQEMPNLLQECKVTLPKLKSNRLKKLTRKVMSRYAALHARLAEPATPVIEALRPELPTLEAIGRRGLEFALKIQTLEDALVEMNESEMYESLQRVEAEFLETHDSLRIDELMRQRQFHARSLERLREAQQAVSMLYTDLIRASSTLGSLLGRISSLQDMPKQSSEQNLTTLLEGMDAQVKIARSVVAELGP